MSKVKPWVWWIVFPLVAVLSGLLTSHYMTTSDRAAPASARHETPATDAPSQTPPPSAPPSLAARLELLALLRGREFAELTRRVESEQAAFEADPGREFPTNQMWDTFAPSDPSLAPALAAWVEAVDSYAPRVALGLYHARAGGRAIGGNSPWEASPERDAMREHYERASDNLLRALELHPRLIVAFDALIGIGRARFSADELRGFVDRSTQACPSCVIPPAVYLSWLAPRQGGSYPEMERYLADLEPRMKQYPRLAVLRGFAASDRAASAAERKDYESAVRLYDEALGYGDYWVYRHFRGKALAELGRFEEALADHEYWLAHGTRSAEALLWKALTLGRMDRFAEGRKAIDLARRLDPGDDDLARAASWLDEAGSQ